MTQPIALLLSLTIEVPVVLGVARLRGWGEPRQLLLVALAATLLTHPFAWYGVGWVAPWAPFPSGWLLVEATVTLVEGALYAKVARLGAARGLLVSLLANATSASIGLAWFFLT